MHMDDAQLDVSLRIDAVYRIREALQTVLEGNQDVPEDYDFQAVSAHSARTLRLHFRPATYLVILSGLRCGYLALGRRLC